MKWLWLSHFLYQLTKSSKGCIFSVLTATIFGYVTLRLYSDRTVVQSKFWPAAELPLSEQLVVFYLPGIHWSGYRGLPNTSLTSLLSEGLHVVRVCRKSNRELPIPNPVRYHFTTAEGEAPKIYSLNFDACNHQTFAASRQFFSPRIICTLSILEEVIFGI